MSHSQPFSTGDLFSPEIMDLLTQSAADPTTGEKLLNILEQTGTSAPEKNESEETA